MLVQTRAPCSTATGKLEDWFSCTDCSSNRGLRRDTCGYYRGVGTSGGLAGFVLPLSKCLVHRDSESGRVSRDGELSPRIVSLSWAKMGHPAGFKLSRAVPTVMWQMGIFNVRL